MAEVDFTGKRRSGPDYTKYLEMKVRELEMEVNFLRKEIDYYKGEINKLMSPPLIEGTVIEVLDEGRALVKSTTGPTLVVSIGGNIDKSKLTSGTRVALNQRGSTIVELLPTDNDPYVKGMEVIERPNVKYTDIGGLDKQIQELREVVELPLKHPELFKEIGVEPPKGILLYGPPGCGKTLLAKAVASESDAYFIPVNGPEIMSKFYGESEQRLREIFEEAQKHSPAIIFIDELDAIAPKRDEVIGEVERRVVAQLLTLLDGLTGRGDVIVIGATNRPHGLDPALRRPGRFDREIEIPLPDKQGRLEILQIHTRNAPLDDDVDLKKLAEITHGFTGADLAALVKEAAMHSLRRILPLIDLDDEIPPEILEKLTITMEDFMKALREVTPSGLREVLVEVPEVKWEDIGGLEDVKQQLRETVEWPIRNPEAYSRLGIEPPKGILLYGPPGCGKTLLAKAVAGESKATFISLVSSELAQKFVGEGARIVRELFNFARKKAPSIVLIDEIDAIAAKRLDMGTSGEREIHRTLTQLLAELDGFDPLDNVKVIATTNRLDILDPALLRPGRFDRVIEVPLPNFEGRKEIFRIHTRKMKTYKIDIDELARITEGATGADIKAICTEAGYMAIRAGRKRVIMEDFLNAAKKVLKGRYRPYGSSESFKPREGKSPTVV